MKLTVIPVDGGFAVMDGDEILAKFPHADDARLWAMNWSAKMQSEGRRCGWVDLTGL